jgi:hypothetical protein
MRSTVREIMTTRVIWVRRDASFREMAAALRSHRVSAFPVLDDAGRVIGVVSEADLLAKEVVGAEPEGVPAMINGILHRRDAEKARGITAGDLMTPPHWAGRSCAASGTCRAWWPSATGSPTRGRGLTGEPQEGTIDGPARLPGAS